MSNYASATVLTCAEVAKLLRVSTRHVLNLCSSGDLRAFRVGKSWRIERAAVAEYMEANSNTGRSA